MQVISDSEVGLVSGGADGVYVLCNGSVWVNPESVDWIDRNGDWSDCVNRQDYPIGDAGSVSVMGERMSDWEKFKYDFCAYFGF